MKNLISVLATGVGIACASSAMAQNEVEVLHYYTSGGEAAAINAIRSEFEKAGGTWVDSPIAGGGGGAHDTALRSRALSGDAPGAAQPKAPDARLLYEAGFMASLGTLPQEEGWDEILPPLLQDLVKDGDNYFAVPIDIHRTNLMWINPELLKSVDAVPPTTWDEFNELAEKFIEIGIVPLAHGGQAWQDLGVFETVLLGIGGADYYTDVMVKNDPAAIDSETMTAVFDQMRQMRGFVDSNFSGRDWNLATTMVMQGEGAIQIMGDWAKGEIINADLEPGVDILCVPTPGNAYILNSNSFAFFKQDGQDVATEGQLLLAKTFLTPEAQKSYNLFKGAIPSRLGVDLSSFDVCAQNSANDLETAIEGGDLVPSLMAQMASTPQIRGAIQEVVTEHFNSDMSSEEAIERMLNAVEGSL